MKSRLLIVVLLLGFSVSLHATGADSLSVTSRRSFSLEIGTGVPPLTSLLNRPSKSELADKGQEATDFHHYCLNLTGCIRISPYAEFALTGNYSWCYHKTIQYGSFGYTHDGEPRYDLSRGTSTRWDTSNPVLSLTGQFRFLWSREWETVQGYSALGLGLFYDGESIYPSPSLTIIGLRFGGRLYGFVENTYGPQATFIYGGLGWKFR